MSTKRDLFAHFILSLLASIYCGKCPPQELINPCHCDSTTIKCGGSQTINLKQIFQSISLNLKSKNDKHFTYLLLNNTAITDLGDNLFHDITFKFIYLDKTTNLRHISPNIFSNYIIDTIEEFGVSGPSILGKYPYIKDTFTALNSLTNIRIIYVRYTQLTIIPEHAFNLTNALQNNLEQLDFWYNQIESVGDYAFYYLSNLTKLILTNNQLNHISKHAFDFWKKSENELYIDLSDNRLNDTSIELEAFTHAKRPLSIDLRNNEFTTLEENIFGPILRMHKRNKISTYGNPIECDCRMLWLFKERDLHESQISDYLFCKNGKKFWSMTERDFIKCNK